MLKLIRWSIVLLSLLLTTALVVFWVMGSRDGLCIYWARQPGSKDIDTRYWQLDSAQGQMQLLALDRYRQGEPMHAMHSDRGGSGRTARPLVGAVLAARVGKDPLRL